MSTIVTRAGKGSALTYNEVDSNFTNLNNDKYQSGDSASLSSLSLATALPITSGGTGASNASTARTNLGLGSAATTSSSDYATSAQGAKADSALQSSNIGSTVLAYDSNLQSFVNTFTLPTTDGIANQVLKTDGYGNIGFTTLTNTGTVTSVGMTVPTGLSISGSPITTSGTLALTFSSGYSIPTTTKQGQWDTAYSERQQWDGGSTNLVDATARTSLGATTLGSNIFTITNPSAITFPRFNADNTVSALSAATFRTAIGAGTGNGTVTSVAALTLGTTGTDLSSTVANGTTTPVITLNVPTASASNRGALSSTDWSTFNGKQAALVSGTNIKTVSGSSLLGSGDVGTIGVAYGGTGQTSYTDGQLLIGNSTGNTLTKSTLTAGSGISITNGSGSITIAATGGGGSMVYPGAGIAVSTGSAWGTSLTAPSGTIVGTTDTQTLSNKTITGTKETVYTITDGAGFEIDPANGGIQTITLGASRTPAATNFTAGQSVTLMIDDGTAYTITWTTVSVTWVGGAAPTLATSGYTVIELWKVGTKIYGAHVGNVA